MAVAVFVMLVDSSGAGMGFTEVERAGENCSFLFFFFFTDTAAICRGLERNSRMFIGMDEGMREHGRRTV